MAALQAKRGEPFAWGRNDCATFACDIAEAVCGVDFADPLRGRYKTRRGAARVLKGFAGGGLDVAAEKIAVQHGRPEVAPSMARRGDLVLIDTDLGLALGVCVGESIASAGPDGVALMPLSAARRAWRV